MYNYESSKTIETGLPAQTSQADLCLYFLPLVNFSACRSGLAFYSLGCRMKNDCSLGPEIFDTCLCESFINPFPNDKFYTLPN